jgi:Ca-activated chloride channel homolog
MMLGQLEFREPIWLILIVLAPVVYFLGQRSKGVVLYSSLSLLQVQHTSWRQKLVWLPSALFTMAAILLSISLSGPRIGNSDSIVKREGIAIMMIVDTSGSMRALDLSESGSEEDRLSVSKRIFEQFVLGDGTLPGRDSDSIGIIRFAGYADTACPLTLDHGSLVGVARSLEIVSNKNEDGTAIGDAVALAIGRLMETPARSKIAILLTDGVNNSGVESPLAAAELAKTEGVKVYTIGAGTNGMAPVRVQDPISGRSVLRGMPVQLDEETLKAISQRSGGKYFRATDFSSLKEVYKEIDALERTKLSQKMYRQYTEYYIPLLLTALILAIIGTIGNVTVFRRSP